MTQDPPLFPELETPAAPDRPGATVPDPHDRSWPNPPPMDNDSVIVISQLVAHAAHHWPDLNFRVYRKYDQTTTGYLETWYVERGPAPHPEVSKNDTLDKSKKL